VEAAEWDARYAATDLVWGLDPNRFVAAELAGRQPGRALDIACGEGRNAIWLAARGWLAVGVDFSATAIERARQLAAEAGVTALTEFVVGDVVSDLATGSMPEGTFDAVVVAYLHLIPEQRRRALHLAAGRLAPGGLLLVVGHDTSNLTEGVGGPQDADVLFTPEDVVTDLDDALAGNWVVDKAERVHRPVGERLAIDALVVGRRT
jgi:SAM-dependent methyltransferase